MPGIAHFSKHLFNPGEPGSLQRRFTLFLSGILLFLFFFLAASAAIFMVRRDTRDWQSEEAAAAQEAAQNISVAVENASISLSLSSRYLDGQPEHDSQILQSLLGGVNSIREVIELDGRNRLLAAETQAAPRLAEIFHSQTASMPEWLRAARSGKSFLGFTPLPPLNQNALLIAAPAPSGGVAIARLDPGILQGALEQVALGSDQSLLVVDSSRQILASSAGEENHQSLPGTAYPGQFAAQAGPEIRYAIYQNLQGQRVVAARVGIPRTDWQVISEQRLWEVYSPSLGSFFLFVSIFCLLSLLSLQVMNRAFANLVLSPLALLEKGAERIGKGDLDYRLLFPGKDEVSKVAEAFDRMATRLQYQQQEVSTKTEAITSEIKKRIQIEMAQRESEERYRLIAENVSDVIWLCNRELELTYISPSVIRLRGYSAAETLAQGISGMLMPGSAEQVLQLLIKNRSLVEKRSPTRPRFDAQTMELEMIRKEGDSVLTETRFTLLFDKQGAFSGIMGVSRDITLRKQMEIQLQETHAWLEARVHERTQELDNANRALKAEIAERKRAEQMLTHKALHDDLTGLPNRRMFIDQLEMILQGVDIPGGKQAAVLFLDLDRFKLINDSLGHLFGDQYLVAISQKLSHCLRAGDTIARFGGDEFAFLLENINDVQDAIQVAERVQVELTNPVEINGFEVYTSASIGISLTTGGYTQPEELLRDADTAMYQAKAAGRGRYQIFDIKMYIQTQTLLSLEADLRRAIEREEFELNYQPIFNLETHEITGIEALLRWRHPHRGLMRPAEFLSVAEESGLIFPINRWVLRTACAQMQTWRQMGFLRPVLSVNVTTRQLRELDLAQQVSQALDDTRLPANALKVEILEGFALRDLGRALMVLQALKERGVQIAIDNFGVRNSSLSYLKLFPINTLKIDQEFVQNINRQKSDTAIVSAIISLAKMLDLQVVAEGVEDASQLATLRKMGCDCYQGYLASYPLSSGEMTRRLMEEQDAS